MTPGGEGAGPCEPRQLMARGLPGGFQATLPGHGVQLAHIPQEKDQGERRGSEGRVEDRKYSGERAPGSPETPNSNTTSPLQPSLFPSPSLRCFDLLSGKIPPAMPVSYGCEKDKTGYKALCKLATVRYSQNNLQGKRHQPQGVCRA